MKRILVVDESQAVRETLGILLGRDFAVAQRPALPEDHLSLLSDETDLLVLGVPPEVEGSPGAVSKIAAQLSCPVLLLVHSRSSANRWEGLEPRVDCLAKPFNPYALREKVERLLAPSAAPLQARTSPAGSKSRGLYHLEFPYVPVATSALAKRYAAAALPTLITGEEGCGQAEVARAMYSLNEGAGPWVSAYPPVVTKAYVLRQIEGFSNATLFLSNLEALDPAAQASFLAFLEEEEEKGRQFWLFSTCQGDLLEKVYRGEFLSPLYYRLATLTLRLPPLRERRADIPSLAEALAKLYAERLNLGKVSFSAAATERLCNYLWFGNLHEMEAVVARSLAVHRKGLLDAPDLVLGSDERVLMAAAAPGPRAAAEEKRAAEQKPPVPQTPAAHPAAIPHPAGNGLQAIPSRPTNGDSPDIKVLINELAHELKNPMVTIKTFAQLLGERFDDAAFRVRFQETVGSDIERMDDLLEAMLDFSRFTHPVAGKMVLYEQMRRVLEEIVPECIKRGATIRWGKKGEAGEVFADEAQFRYAFKNVLRAVLAQMRPTGEIQLDVEAEGRVALYYVPEGGRMSPLTQYLDISSVEAEVEALPLRILLAKILFERNGGDIKVTQLKGGKVLIRAELPVA